MPVWPKTYYEFRANWLTAGRARDLRRSRRSRAEQEKIFTRLVEQLARTSFWSTGGIERGMSYEDFRKRVAVRTYAQIRSAVEEMVRGGRDVLWPGVCTRFLRTAGTTTGQGQLLPATDALLDHFRAGGTDAVLHYTARVGHAGVFQGRHLLLAGSTQLQPLAEAASGAPVAGEISGLLQLDLPAWVERHFHEPGTEISQISDWNERLDALVARAGERDLTMIAGLPTYVLQLAERVRRWAAGRQRSATRLTECWPNLECYLHGGMPITPYQEELRAVLGSGVVFHEVYAATEAILAAQDGESSAGLRVLSRAGVFFEFLPVAEWETEQTEMSGAKAVPLAEVKPGVDYVVLLTTPGGLARYVLGDIVRFLSVEPPRLIVLGRTLLQLSLFGERLHERDLTGALVAVCERQKWSIVDFHVAPLSAANLTGQQRGRHEWWVELKPGSVITPKGPQIASQLDAALIERSPDYAARRKAGVIEEPLVRLVMPGVFEHWLRYRGTWGGLHRTPRCRNDRSLAGELAQITSFGVG